MKPKQHTVINEEALTFSPFRLLPREKRRSGQSCIPGHQKDHDKE
jgi:hypothetical protein